MAAAIGWDKIERGSYFHVLRSKYLTDSFTQSNETEPGNRIEDHGGRKKKKEVFTLPLVCCSVVSHYSGAHEAQEVGGCGNRGWQQPTIPIPVPNQNWLETV